MYTKFYYISLKQDYDLIVVDCPPNLGQSVAAITLAADLVVAPVVPENFALSGLKITCNSIKELEHSYNTNIKFKILVNKYDARTILSQDALHMLSKHPLYSPHLLQTYIRTSQEFPNAIARGKTIFDQIKPTIAKTDVDSFTRELLKIDHSAARTKNKGSVAAKNNINSFNLEESLI